MAPGCRSINSDTQLDQLRTAPLITSGVIGWQFRVSAYLGNQRHEITLASAHARRLTKRVGTRYAIRN